MHEFARLRNGESVWLGKYARRLHAMAFATSLFTHLLESDAQHYLRETARVLKQGGLAFISLHIEPAAGTRYSGTEARIDVDADYFVELAGKAGLRLKERPGDLCGQEIVVLERV